MNAVIEKVRKLIAHAESAGKLGSTEEAATFAEKAAELCLKHKLEMTDLERVQEEAETSVGGDIADAFTDDDLDAPGAKRVSPWLVRLASGVADAHLCRVYTIPASRRVIFVGREADRKAAAYLFTVLARDGYRMSHLHWVATRRMKPQPPRAAGSFLDGYVAAIRKRLVETKARVAQAGGQHALTVFSDALKQADEWAKKVIEPTPGKPLPKKGVHMASYLEGQRRGIAAPLGGIAAGKAAPGTTLSRGQALLASGETVS